jgi:hypothetical protein
MHVDPFELRIRPMPIAIIRCAGLAFPMRLLIPDA